MRTEITHPADGFVNLEIVLSRENVEDLLRGESFSNGVIRVDGKLLLPFHDALAHVSMEENEIHEAHPVREEAKQLIRDARVKA